MDTPIRIDREDVDRLFEFHGLDNAGGAIYFYEGHPFTGIIEYYYPSGNLEAESEYLDGHIGGLQKEYYDNGNVKEEYYQFFGRIDRYFKIWDEQGTLIHHTIWDGGTRGEKII